MTERLDKPPLGKKLDPSKVDLQELEKLRKKAGMPVATAANHLDLTENGWYQYVVNDTHVDSMIIGKLQALLIALDAQPKDIYADTAEE